MKGEAYINGEVGDGAKPFYPAFHLFHLFQFVSCVPAVSPVSRNIASRSETKQIMYTNFKQRLDGVIGEVKDGKKSAASTRASHIKKSPKAKETPTS